MAGHTGTFLTSQVLRFTILTTFLLPGMTHAQANPPNQTQSLTECLEGVVGRASVSLPGRDPGYENATLIHDRAFQGYPVAITYPNTTADVQGIVLCSRAGGVQAVPRSGGHSYGGYSVINGTVLVDLSRVDEFTLSPDHKSARVGTGNRLGPLYYKAWTQAGKVFPAGLCPYVGAGGHILGGGVGLLTRKYGLASDQLTEVEMVMYNGSVVTANSSSHPDLFFASRGGGGGSFGIVTSYNLTLLDTGNGGDVILFLVSWGADSYDIIPDFMRKIQTWAPNAPEELSIQVFLGDGGFHVLGVFVGTEGEFLPVFQQSGLTELPGYSAANFAPFNNSLYITIPYIEAALYFGSYTMGLSGTGKITDLLLGPDTKLTYADGPYKAKSSIINEPVSDAGLEVIKDYISASKPPSYLEFNSLGGAMTRISPTETAYPHRGGIFDLQFQAGWDTGNATEQASQLKWLDNFYSALQPYVSPPRAYVNYIDNQLPDSLNRYFGVNLPRLEQVKAAYDPVNYFNNPQSIPLPTGAPNGAPVGAPGNAPKMAPVGALSGAYNRAPIRGTTGQSTGGVVNGSQATTWGPAPTYPTNPCNAYGALPNQCFNRDGSAFICCPGACAPGPRPSGAAPLCA